MPRKGGIEATQDIRAMEARGILSSRIPIIAVSANARSGQVEAVRPSSSAMTWIFANSRHVISADSTDARCWYECIRQQTFPDDGVIVQDRSSYRKAPRSKAEE